MYNSRYEFGLGQILLTPDGEGELKIQVADNFIPDDKGYLSEVSIVTL
jgi:hypothetical protein